MATDVSSLAAWRRCLLKLRLPSSGLKPTPWGTSMALVPPSRRAGARVTLPALRDAWMKECMSEGLTKGRSPAM